jgi:hypothetical protein
LAVAWISGFGFVGISIECRRIFYGNESLNHGRRTCGGIHVERASNRQSLARSAVIEISRRAI